MRPGGGFAPDAAGNARGTVKAIASERPADGALLLELLRLAGWRVDLRGGEAPRVRATRDGVRVEAARDTVGEAAVVVFLAAMRSGAERRRRTADAA